MPSTEKPSVVCYSNSIHSIRLSGRLEERLFDHGYRTIDAAKHVDEKPECETGDDGSGENLLPSQRSDGALQDRTKLPVQPVNVYVDGMAFDFFSRNGTILPMTDAQVPLSNIEYAYGFGVYETIRVVHGTPIFLEAHLKRLMLSAATIELLHLLTEKQIEEWIRTLVTKISADTCNLKILLIGGRTSADATLWILPLAPLFPDKKLFRDGVSVITVPHERFLPHAKTLNMLPSYLFYRKAKEAGCYDALLIDRHGTITEGTRTNVLAIRERTIVSPPTKNILEGVMRSNVLQVARDQGFEILEETIPLQDIKRYDGFFLTSTSSKILPISRINEIVIGIPEEGRELMKIFDTYLEGVYGRQE